jgi:hypothetical protein
MKRKAPPTGANREVVDAWGDSMTTRMCDGLTVDLLGACLLGGSIPRRVLRQVGAGLVALCTLLPTACTRSESAATSRSDTPVAGPDAGASVAAAPLATKQITIPHAEVTPEVEQQCARICERSRQLKCKRAADCPGSCVAMATVTPCSASMEDLYRCLAAEPLAHWECADDGVAAIREGYCDQQQGQTVACMEAKMPAAEPHPQ